jgi:hypothetical protein
MTGVTFAIVRHMETQHDFIERRRLGHIQAAMEAENDPLIKALFGPHESRPITERERRLFCYEPGFMLRRQAGDPLDVPVSSADTATSCTESGSCSAHGVGRRRNRRRYLLRLLRCISRTVRGFQSLTARLSPAP